MQSWGVIYQYCDIPSCAKSGTKELCDAHGYYKVLPPPIVAVSKALNANYAFDVRTFLGIMLLALGLGGLIGPLIPTIRLEAQYAYSKLPSVLGSYTTTLSPESKSKPLPKAVPVVFEPLKSADGTVIEPVSQDFGIVIPKIGVNALVIPGVDPTSSVGYADALEAGVAHANTSFYPGQDGTVYLFSHSTNYDWFVKDLNAVFYLVKNLEKDDIIVLLYKQKRYTYKITSKKVVSPTNISYLIPYAGKKNLILQTCWPPGSTTERLLIFADLIEEDGKQI